MNALVIALQLPGESWEVTQENAEEMRFLAESAGYHVVDMQVYRWRTPDPATFLTRGRIERLAAHLPKEGVVFVDAELSPVQVRNLETFWNLPVTDRTGLILEIFARNARSAQAQAQVQLAKLQYELPRLTHKWTHLSRERGGIGMRAGGGEQQLEADRRKIRHQIAHLRQKIALYEKQAHLRRKHRENIPRVALVGYTNVGKSTLFNLITKSDVLVADRLFATLDTTVRRVTTERGTILFSDTVGFIRKLPHMLIAAFRSTLAEVREADLLLHVIDSSSPNYLLQIRNVENTLAEIQAGEIPMILVFNKIDKLSAEDLELFQHSWRARAWNPVVFISAAHRIGIQDLYDTIFRQLHELRKM